MNKTEEQWAWMLTAEKNKGKITWFDFEPITFRLTSKVPGQTRVSYTPDFLVGLADGTVRVDEVKGPFIREDSVLKFKMAADRFPLFSWRMVQLQDDGDFHLIRYFPRRKIPGRGTVKRFPKTDG